MRQSSRKSRAFRNSTASMYRHVGQAGSLRGGWLPPPSCNSAFRQTVIKSGLAMTLNGYLVKSTIVAALGGLLFGFDTAVIAGATHALTEAYHLSPGTLGLTVAAALWA